MIPYIKPPKERTEAEIERAKQKKSSHQYILKKMSLKQGGCADCTNEKLGWIVLPHGIFVCSECAVIHRKLGSLVSVVKSYEEVDYWFDDEITAIQRMGNVAAKGIYRVGMNAPERLESETTFEEKMKKAKIIYEERRYFGINDVTQHCQVKVSEGKLHPSDEFFANFGL